jgi:hypothetical protein
MTKTSFNRDNILSSSERIASARKCLDLLSPEVENMGDREAEFVSEMMDKVERWGVTERQLAWLRDLVGKYAQ